MNNHREFFLLANLNDFQSFLDRHIFVVQFYIANQILIAVIVLQEREFLFDKFHGHQLLKVILSFEDFPIDDSQRQDRLNRLQLLKKKNCFGIIQCNEIKKKSSTYQQYNHIHVGILHEQMVFHAAFYVHT